MPKILFLLIIGFLEMKSKLIYGQSMSAELSGLDAYWSLKVSTDIPLVDSGRISITNSTRITSAYPYKKDMSKLIITNLGYDLNRNFTSSIGCVYSSSFGVKPSVGIMYSGKSGSFFWILYPNLNITKNPDILMPMLIQLSKGIRTKLDFIFKTSALVNFDKTGHLYSGVRIRTGLNVKNLLFGLASDFRYSGKNFEASQNYGAFLQYYIF